MKIVILAPGIGAKLGNPVARPLSDLNYGKSSMEGLGGLISSPHKGSENIAIGPATLARTIIKISIKNAVAENSPDPRTGMPFRSNATHANNLFR